MATTITRTMRSETLEVEVETTDAGKMLVSAWERCGSGLGDALFLNVPGEKLSEVVSLVAAALAPEATAEQLAHEREAFAGLRQALAAGERR